MDVIMIDDDELLDTIGSSSVWPSVLSSVHSQPVIFILFRNLTASFVNVGHRRIAQIGFEGRNSSFQRGCHIR